MSSGDCVSFLGGGIVDGDTTKMKAKAQESDFESAPLVLGPSPVSSPSDLCLSTYLIFYVHGIGHLLPWNFFITAHSYFESKFTCPSNGNHSCYGDLQHDFENYFSVATMGPIVVMTGVNIWLQSKVHYKYRMVVSLIAMILLFGLTLALVRVQTSSWVNGFFFLTLITVVFISGFSAVFQSSTFGFAGVFPSKYISIVLSGQACAGVFAALVLIISLAVASKDPVTSALGYFSTALLIVGLCLVLFIVMLRLRFVKFYLSGTSIGVQERIKTLQSHSNKTALTTPTIPFWRTFWDIKVYALSVFLIFSVTLSLFPSVLSMIKSSSGWDENYFNPIVCFLMFNSSDFVGRYITQWITIGGRPRFLLLILSVLRFVFIPLFLLCNLSRGSIPVVFNNDVFPIFFVVAFGLSNGYFGSVAIVSAPQVVSPGERETASTIMVFCLSSGLFCGSLVSFLWTKLVLRSTSTS